MNHADYYGVFLGEMLEGGKGAFIVQPYDEVNKKLGTQWEVSRKVSVTSVGDKLYSVLVIGDKPIDLKSRTIGATGGGAIGRVYEIQSGDFSITGSADPWYNLNNKIKVQPKSEIYPESSINFITPVASLAVEANKIAADIFAITNTQNQAKGVITKGFGSNRILEPNTILLLELESFDASQDIIASLEMYEGLLDFNVSV